MSDLARRYAQALYGLTRRRRGPAPHRRRPDGEHGPVVRPPLPRRPGRRKRSGSWPGFPIWRTVRRCCIFTSLLADKGRMALLPEILDAFQDAGAGTAGLRPVRAHLCPASGGGGACRSSAWPYAGSITSSDILFDVRMDPSLLGGFTLELEGVTYDKSVRGALAGLTRQLEERRMA